MSIYFGMTKGKRLFFEIAFLYHKVYRITDVPTIGITI